MHDAIWVATMALWGLVVQCSKQVIFWKLPPYVAGNVKSLRSRRSIGYLILIGLLCLLCLLAGMAIGLILPTMIQNRLPAERGFSYRQPLDVLGQIASIVGGVCGAYVGVRGSQSAVGSARADLRRLLRGQDGTRHRAPGASSRA